MNQDVLVKNAPLVGISSCLLGEKVRFDGGHKQNSYILKTLSQYFTFQPFCPEVDIGLGVPRETIHLIRENDLIRCVGTKSSELDVTQALKDSASQQSSHHQALSGYILKRDSPSCGMERVRVYHNGMPQRNGSGIFAQQMMQNHPNLPVEEEGRLGDPVLRENFIQRVFIFYRWKKLTESEISWQLLNRFHAQHKYILMSHNQEQARTLGRELAEANTKMSAEEFIPQYGADLMVLLKQPATRKNHTNVLQHIQGYLKSHLDKDDKQELTESIENYRLGLLPLIVPITLLKHYFRKYPNDYMVNSYYLSPHPSELMLLNHI